MKYDVFGKRIEIKKNDSGWLVFYLGNEGKRRLAGDIIIPPDISEDKFIEYLSDLCHEWARTDHSEVKKLD